MRFSRKLLLWTTIIIALTLGFSGFYFVNYVFQTSLEREIGQALDENSILRFAFETAALNVPLKYDLLQDGSVEQIASNLETSGQGSGRLLRISDEEKQVLYASDGFGTDGELLEQMEENKYSYRVIQLGEHYYIQTGSSVNALGRVLYLETLRDVSQVFEERDTGFTVYRRLTVLMLALGIGIMYFIASRLTKPIRLLMKATKEMAGGDYSYRARQVSTDELGQLTQDFNHMSEELEKTIGQLEEEVQSRDEFVGAFAHELKTPLTSIIGYADMLRSRKLDEEKSFRSANYIYTEGKRLETMSLRLLDIMVTKKDGAKIQRIPTETLFEYLQGMFLPNERMEFDFTCEQAVVSADPSLIQTVLVNLIDNACKASEPGDRIEIEGHIVADMPDSEQKEEGTAADKRRIERNAGKGQPVEKEEGRYPAGRNSVREDAGERNRAESVGTKNAVGEPECRWYRFSVRDYGIGIPREELSKITQAFYMVDKSRSRSRNGAGLGLALCTEILSLHGSRLEIESVPGKGTKVGFLLREAGKEAQHEEIDS